MAHHTVGLFLCLDRSVFKNRRSVLTEPVRQVIALRDVSQRYSGRPLFVCPRLKRCDVIKAIKSLLKRPVAYHGVLAQALQSVPAAVMLSQGLYWQEIAEKDPKNDGWFYLTSDDWFEQTGLTWRAQTTARKKMSECGFWHEELRGMPAKMHYKIDVKRLASTINQYLDSGIAVSTDCRNKSPQVVRTSSGKISKHVSTKCGNKIDYKETNKETNKEFVGKKKPTLKNKPKTSKTKKQKAPPNSAAPPRKKEPTLTWQMREVFEQHYKRLFNDEIFDWQAKEWAAVKQIGNKLRERLDKKQMPKEDSDVLNSWNQFLQMASDCDEWTVENGFTPSRLNGNYQSLIQKIIAKNGKAKPKLNARGKEVIDPATRLERAIATGRKIADEIAAGKL